MKYDLLSWESASPKAPPSNSWPGSLGHTTPRRPSQKATIGATFTGVELWNMENVWPGWPATFRAEMCFRQGTVESCPMRTKVSI
jgi:hypothetical protein